MRQELKQAAAQKLGSVRSRRAEPASEVERVLLRALVLPESDPARQRAAQGLSEDPAWYDGLPAAPLFDALAHAPAPENPLDAAPDDHTRALLAEVLASTSDPTLEPPTHGQTPPSPADRVENALETLKYKHMQRRKRELRTLIAEAERKGDQETAVKLSHELRTVEHELAALKAS